MTHANKCTGMFDFSLLMASRSSVMLISIDYRKVLVFTVIPRKTCQEPVMKCYIRIIVLEVISITLTESFMQ